MPLVMNMQMTHCPVEYFAVTDMYFESVQFQVRRAWCG